VDAVDWNTQASQTTGNSMPMKAGGDYNRRNRVIQEKYLKVAHNSLMR
jgi:hypothetical protein